MNEYWTVEMYLTNYKSLNDSYLIIKTIDSFVNEHLLYDKYPIIQTYNLNYDYEILDIDNLNYNQIYNLLIPFFEIIQLNIKNNYPKFHYNWKINFKLKKIIKK